MHVGLLCNLWMSFKSCGHMDSKVPWSLPTVSPWLWLTVKSTIRLTCVVSSKFTCEARVHFLSPAFSLLLLSWSWMIPIHSYRQITSHQCQLQIAIGIGACQF